MDTATHSVDSSLREQVLEHLFIGDLLRWLWNNNARDIEVLRADVDRAGYDVVVEANGVMRHIQLKASYHAAKTASVNINTALAEKPGGCVIWIRFDPDTMEFGPFLWFGGAPGEALPPLGDKVARHTKGNRKGEKAERASIRVLNKGRFTVLEDIGEVARALFA